MNIIEGFNQARALLTRESSFALSLPSPRPEDETPEDKLSTDQIVRRIITDVRDKGDKAVLSYTEKLDRVRLSSLEVTQNEVSAAYQNLDKKLIEALELAANRIHAFHSVCKQRLESSFLSHGLGRQVSPLHRVGIYVPGGTAAYPSTVLMTAVPARVAGVNEIIVATPPQEDGTIWAPTLAAADIAKVNRVFKIGGAQAIAALAFGTETVPKVDKICGPGNAFVVAAKRMVYGIVGIESLPGPSEVVIVADDTANASFCAADLIAQAEHDPLASAILITTSSELARKVDSEVELQLGKLERRTTAAQAIDSNGMIILVDSPDDAIELVNLYAPEHVSLMLRNASAYVGKIRNAGCIFVGGSSPVALGDYVAGPSHVLPTGGSARFSSPLNVEDFLKVANIVALNETDARELGQAAITIAEAEGLKGHAQAIRARLRTTEEENK